MLVCYKHLPLKCLFLSANLNLRKKPRKFGIRPTAKKESVFRVILVRIFPGFSRRITPNTDAFYAVAIIIINLLKGTAKLSFIYYSCVVIILFNAGLYKSAFSTYSLILFGKLGFLLLYVLNSMSSQRLKNSFSSSFLFFPHFIKYDHKSDLLKHNTEGFRRF